MFLPGEILALRVRKSAEAIVGEANPDSMKPMLVLSESGEASSEGLNIKQREILTPCINSEADQWMLIQRLVWKANQTFSYQMEKYLNLMPVILSKSNMLNAYKRVVSNGGSAGVDGMKVRELQTYLNENWTRICKELENGTYQPQEVKGVEIPKPNGGVRLLRYPNRYGSTDPTGDTSGVEPNMGFLLFQIQLRLPPKQASA